MRSLSVLVLALLATTAKADIILEIESPAPLSPSAQSVSFDVYARSLALSKNLGSFFLKFDLYAAGDGIGTGLPSGISKSANFVTNPIFAPNIGNFVNDESAALVDTEVSDFFIMGDGGVNNENVPQTATITDQNTRLFTLNFDVTNIALGTKFTLAFSPSENWFPPSGLFEIVGGEERALSVTEYNSGSVDFSVVPEPSATLLILSVAGAALVRRRNRST